MSPRPRRSAFACRDLLAAVALALGVGAVATSNSKPDPNPVSPRRTVGPEIAQACAMIVARDSHSSAAILSPDGLILTNAHAVASRLRESEALNEPARLPVRLGRFEADRMVGTGEELWASVLATDPARDLALLKIELPAGHAPLPHVRLAKGVRLGEPVLALGCPRNAFPFMIKTGTVAGLGSLKTGRTRFLADSARLAAGFSTKPAPARDIALEAVATTVALAPGDSGGPLLNAEGELIGLNLSVPTDDPASVSFHVSLPEIRLFLAEHPTPSDTLAGAP
jgi:S1-C subfamily serine protease